MVYPLMKYSRDNSVVRPHGSRKGFTLLEILFALVILAILVLWTIHFLVKQIDHNRVTAYEIAGTHIIRGKVEEILAASIDNKGATKGTVNGVLLFMHSVRAAASAHGAGYPISVIVNPADGTIVYSFYISDLGSSSPLTGTPTQILNSNNTTARGTLTLFLRENNVPADFTRWNDITQSTSVPFSAAGFDIDGNGNFNGNFINLINSRVDLDTTRLNALPVRATVAFYADAAAVTADRPTYSVERCMVINRVM